MGRPAAWRSTNTARAVAVRCGTIRRLARASRPLTVITCWCMPRQQCKFRSGWLCNADQLTLMSTIGPKRATKTETNCGSSREIRGVRGHQAPSISCPSREARVTRTGLAGRAVAGTEGVVGSALTRGPARFIAQPFAFRDDLPARSRRPSNRVVRDLVRGQRNGSPPLRYATCSNYWPRRYLPLRVGGNRVWHWSSAGPRQVLSRSSAGHRAGHRPTSCMLTLNVGIAKKDASAS